MHGRLLEFVVIFLYTDGSFVSTLHVQIFVLSSVNIKLPRMYKFLRAVTWLPVHLDVRLHFHLKH